MTVSSNEAPVLKLLGVWSVLSLPLLPGSPWPRVVVPDRVSSRGEIDLFENYYC